MTGTLQALHNFAKVFTVAASLIFLSGCGEEENKSSASGNAPRTLRGQTYNLTAADTSTIQFSSTADTYLLTQPGNRTDSGTFNATRSGDIWNVVITSSTSGSAQSELVLTFSGEGIGAFTFRENGASAPVSGQFQRSSTNSASAVGAGGRAGNSRETGTLVGAFASVVSAVKPTAA